MKTFKRFKSIVSANMNSALDKMEDPQKMIRLLIAELEETLTEAKVSTAARIADKVSRQEEKKQVESGIKRWTNRAELAVEKGRDDLAREALKERKHLEGRLDVLDMEVAQLEEIVAVQQDQIVSLQEKLQEMRDKERTLVARAYHAKEKKQVMETLKATDCSSVYQKFAEMEIKVERMEAEAEMAGFRPSAKGTESEFTTMEQQEEIERELAALKAKKAPKASTKKEEATS